MNNDKDKQGKGGLSKEVYLATKAFYDGLRDVCAARSDRPFEFSSAFLLFRMSVPPETASDHLEQIVNDAIRIYLSDTSCEDDIRYRHEGDDIIVEVSGRR